MKKWIYLILAICLAMALTGCGRQDDVNNSDTENARQETTQTKESHATEETGETLSDNTGEPEMDFSDFE